MKQVRIDISKPVLEWALHRMRFYPQVQGKFPIHDWLEGRKKPTLRQVEKFAQSLKIPLGYLFLTVPPQEKISTPYFRTKKEKIELSPEAKEIIATLEQWQSWLREYLIHLGEDPLNYVGILDKESAPEELARVARKILELEPGWTLKFRTVGDALSKFKNTLEEKRIAVSSSGIVGTNTRRRIDVNELRGLVLIDQFAPFMFVNSGDAKSAQMFTLAHEFMHILIGQSASFDLTNLEPSEDPAELLCNKAAAEFLVPSEIFTQKFKEYDVEELENRIGELAREFKVSRIVILRRTLELYLISKEKFRQLYGLFVEDLRRQRTTGGDFYRNQRARLGNLFSKMIFYAVREGYLLHTEAFKLTGLKGKTFDRYFSQFEGIV